jgi:uncharacterized protein
MGVQEMPSYSLAVNPQPSPIGKPDRIDSLDALRGIALLGILLVNIFSFAQPHYSSPNAYGDLHGANFAVWLFSHTFAYLKFLSIFSMLFGAGVYLFTSRIEGAGRQSGWLHYRRMLVLIMFGLLHAYFLWFGDILVHYGICGLLLYPFRQCPPRRLILIGTVILLIPILAGVFYISTMGPNDFQEFEKDLHPTPSAVASDLATFRGGWLGQLSTRANEALEFETTVFGWEYFWRELGLMLIGMALFKLGVFSAALTRAVYLRMIIAAILFGIPLTWYGVYANYKVGWQSMSIYFRGEFVDYVASLFVAFGWVGAIMLACKSPALRLLTYPLKAVGRAAFSNYILQTLICTTLFYGHGFGLYGHISRVGQFGIVLVIWALQLIVSTLWFRFFRMGPLESLWRSLTYWKPQPLRVKTFSTRISRMKPEPAEASHLAITVRAVV